MGEAGRVYGAHGCAVAEAGAETQAADVGLGEEGQGPYGEPLSSKPVEQLTPREVGMEGERLAVQYLRATGLEVLRRNYRTVFGEADVVCQDGDTTVFVEVKTRLALGAGARPMPEIAVDDAKQRRYSLLALEWLVSHPVSRSVRFDVIAVSITGPRRAKLRHLCGAFAWDD